MVFVLRVEQGQRAAPRRWQCNLNKGKDVLTGQENGSSHLGSSPSWTGINLTEKLSWKLLTQQKQHQLPGGYPNENNIKIKIMDHKENIHLGPVSSFRRLQLRPSIWHLRSSTLYICYSLKINFMKHIVYVCFTTYYLHQDLFPFFNLNFIKKYHTYKTTYTYSLKKKPPTQLQQSPPVPLKAPPCPSWSPSIPPMYWIVLIISLLSIYHVFNGLVLAFTETEPPWMYSSATCFFHHWDSSLFTCAAVVQSDFCVIPL